MFTTGELITPLGHDDGLTPSSYLRDTSSLHPVYFLQCGLSVVMSTCLAC